MEFELDGEEVFNSVMSEMERAQAKHKSGFPAGRGSFISILTEEVGEAAQVVNKRQESELLRKEIIQVMAVCAMYLTGCLRDSDK